MRQSEKFAGKIRILTYGYIGEPGKSGSLTKLKWRSQSLPRPWERKKQAIFRHQSQKDRAMFPGGTDKREFWQRSEERNLRTAEVYDSLGLQEFYALEAFVRWKE